MDPESVIALSEEFVKVAEDNKRLRAQLASVQTLAALWEEEAAVFTRVSAQSGGSTALDVRVEANRIHAEAIRDVLSEG